MGSGTERTRIRSERDGRGGVYGGVWAKDRGVPRSPGFPMFHSHPTTLPPQDGGAVVQTGRRLRTEAKGRSVPLFPFAP